MEEKEMDFIKANYYWLFPFIKCGIIALKLNLLLKTWFPRGMRLKKIKLDGRVADNFRHHCLPFDPTLTASIFPQTLWQSRQRSLHCYHHMPSFSLEALLRTTNLNALGASKRTQSHWCFDRHPSLKALEIKLPLLTSVYIFWVFHVTSPFRQKF